MCRQEDLELMELRNQRAQSDCAELWEKLGDKATQKPEKPRFILLSLVDLQESTKHEVTNTQLLKYLSAAIKWQRGAPNRIVLVQSVKSGQVLTAEAALAKIQSNSKKGGKK